MALDTLSNILLPPYIHTYIHTEMPSTHHQHSHIMMGLFTLAQLINGCHTLTHQRHCPTHILHICTQPILYVILCITMLNCKVVVATLRTGLMRIQDGGYTAVDPTLPGLSMPYRSLTV